MIITRSPLRITLGGGGTDLPSYYEEYGGFVLAAAIDKYVYVNLQKRFVNGLLLKYSKLEKVETIDQIQHPIIREALRLITTETDLEISSMADIPAGMGLGSSGSFTTALLKALYTHKRQIILPEKLAELACMIEIGILHNPIGKQDQYIASYGGITKFNFNPGGQVWARPIYVPAATMYDLEDNLLLFSTGYTREASVILQEQDTKSKEQDSEMMESLHITKELGHQSAYALENGNLAEFANLMHCQWHAKKKRSSRMTNENIEKWYSLAMANGAIGGKLIGAGGGGFLMFYVEDKIRVRKVMQKEGLREVRFKFDFEGTKVLIS